MESHFVPRWGLARFSDDENDDPHPWLLSDAEMIAIRVVLSATVELQRTEECEDRVLSNCLSHAETALEKLKCILNAELEDCQEECDEQDKRHVPRMP